MVSNRIKGVAAAAAALLISLEGYGAKPYLDSAGVLTDCYGNTHNVSRGHIRTQAECKALLDTEAGRLASRIVGEFPHAPHSVQVAVVSWAYNVGLGAYRSSTLRKRLQAADWVGACRELPRWNKITVQGILVPLPGLSNRRAKELKVCLEFLQDSTAPSGPSAGS